MRDGGEGRGNVTVNMGQLSLSFLSLFVSYSRLTLDFLQTDQRKVSFFTRTQKRSTSFVFLLHSSSFFFFLPQRCGSRIIVWSVGVVLFPLSCVQFTKSSPPAITLNYPPVTAELMFSRHHSDGAAAFDSRFSTLSQSGSERAMTSAADRRLYSN